jgi:hypothetical protein
MSNFMPTVGIRNGWLLTALGVALVGAAMVSGAILMAGRYHLAGSVNGGTVWRIDTLTGDVSMCETYTRQQTPTCSAWGAKPLPPATR